MSINIEQIIESLDQVLEPSTGQSITLLKMVRDLRLEGENIYFNIHIPSQQYAHKSDLYEAINLNLKKQFPEFQAHVHFINKAPMAEAPNILLPQIKNFVAIGSGKGGVGKSTVTVNLALALSRLGYKTGILDADLYGPSIPTMLGIKSIRPKVDTQNGQNKLIPITTNGISTISLGNIIEPEQAVVLRGPRLAAIIKQFFNDTLWPELDYLLIDLPPGTGDVQLTLVQTIPLTGAIIVTTPQEVALIDAIKAANMFIMEQIAVPILGIIENMSWFQPSDSSEKKYYIFGKGGGERLSNSIKTSFLGQIPIFEKLRERSDLGLVFECNSEEDYAQIYKSIAEKIHQKVALRNIVMAPTKKVEQV